MPIARGNGRHRFLVGGIAWLLVLFFVGVLAGTRPLIDGVAVQLQAGTGANLGNDGNSLLLSGQARGEVAGVMKFSLPPRDPAMSRWVVWLDRDAVDALWLQGPGWRSPERDFFRPAGDEGLLPAGFLLPLPADWQGDITLSLHARSGTRAALRPLVLYEAAATQRAHRGVALQSSIYAGLFLLALLALALYSAARDRAFLALFACASTALLLLLAQNGHLYLLPGFALMSLWRGMGLWALGLLFAITGLQLLLGYAGLQGGTSGKRSIDRYCAVLILLTALALLDLHALNRWLSPLLLLALSGAGIGAVAVLIEAVRRRVPLAITLLLLGVLTMVAALVRAALLQGWLADMLWTRLGYQFALVITIAVVMVGLISRIGEFRQQRDRDHLARMDSERRMQREAARADLALILQTRLRMPDVGDIEWIAFRLLLERLLPQVPAAWAAVVAYGYHGHDLSIVEPAGCKQQVDQILSARELALKRLAQQGLPLQQTADSADGPCIEALLPLPIRAPGCGMLLLQRAGNDGFSTDEMELAGEFARLATLHADEALATAQLRRSAELDALTGTFNRRSMDQWLAHTFRDAHRQQQPLSLLFIDIDYFKSVNDRLGHAGGDQCLRQVAATLRDALEASDMLGRYGGEEFVALLPGRGASDARQIAERLRAAVESCQFLYEGQAERLTVSIGVATRLNRESVPAAAVKRADNALYAAKHGGRNCVHVAPAVFS